MDIESPNLVVNLNVVGNDSGTKQRYYVENMSSIVKVLNGP